MLIIKQIPNVLDKENRKTTEIPYDAQKTILDILRSQSIAFEDKDVVVNGGLCKDLKTVPKDNDQIIVVKPVEDVISALWAIGSWIVEQFAEHWITYTILALSAGYAVLSAVSGRSKMNFGSTGEGLDESSPTYGWDGIVTTQEVGIPVPIIYGRHKVGGNIINQYVSTDGDKNYLNILLGLCEGEINSISDIKINDNPIANFSGVDTYERLGTNSQTVIPNFEDLHSIITINAQLNKDSAYTHTTVETDVEAFQITLSLPNGLYQVDDSGNVVSWDVTYKVEYKLHTDSEWIDLGETTISGKSRSTLRRIFRKEGLTAGQYDIRITKTSDDSSLDPQQTGDLYLQSIDEIVTDDLAYPNTALLGIRALATDQLSGSTPNFTCIVEGRLVSIPKIMNGAVEVDWEDYYWDPDTEQWKLLEDDTVLSWDGETYVDRWCANPIWCLKDLLLNTRYGLGEYIESENINDANFLEMAKHCEERVADGEGGYEKRYRLDIVIDSSSRAMDILTQICATFRAFPYTINGLISFKIDKPGEEDTQIFGMGNIDKGSFQESWKSAQEIPNMVEVQFMDQDLDYEQETIVVTDEDALAAGDPVCKKSIRIFTTKKSYAIREGRYTLYVGKYIKRTCTFKTNMRAIVTLPGDPFAVSHDVPQWGVSGKIKSGSTTTSIKVDRSLTIEAGKSYKITIQHKGTDVIETKNVTTSTPGSYTTIATEAFDNAPDAFSEYIFTEQTLELSRFRLLSIKKYNDGSAEVTGIELNDSVHSDTAPTIPTNNLSLLTTSIPPVTNLALTEGIIKMPDGTIQDYIDVWFRRPDLTNYSVKRYTKAKIYISDNGGDSYEAVGETTSDSFRIQGGLSDGQTYRVLVSSIGDDGSENSLSDCPTSDITLEGKNASPNDITGYAVIFATDHLEHIWDEPNDVDIWGCEIRELPYEGAPWELGVVIATKIGGKSYSQLQFTAGTKYFAIKAIDTSENYSENITTASVIITSVPDQNVIAEFEDYNFTGPLSADGELCWSKLYSPYYYRRAIALKTEETWGPSTLWDNTRLWGTGFDTTASVVYTTVVKDLGAILSGVGISLEVGLESTGGGNLLIEIAFSDSDPDPTNWQTFVNGSYSGRYFKFRFTLSTSNSVYGIRLYKIKAYFDVPDKTQEGTNIAIAGSGFTTISLDGFTEVRTLIISVRGAAYVIETDESALPASFDVKLKDPAAAMAQVAGAVNYFVKGY